MNLPFCLPSHITAEDFLQNYWQKRPLLIRNGLPEIVGLFTPDDIIDLAQTEEVTARLIKTYPKQTGDEWVLKTSPLSAQDFEHLPEQWSVLVQNLEQWSPELGRLWQKFGFIPQWQRDDIMVSYAPAGGAVGKHYDEYDVFLVQGYGHRRWQLGKWCDPSTEFKANQPIRIFDDMGELIFDEILAPGDVLYVPSRLSHYGVAQDDCLTFSFGLRYPNATDLLENICKTIEYHSESLATADMAIPLRLSPTVQPMALLDPQNLATMKQKLIDLLQHSDQFDALFQHAVANTVTTRRYELLTSTEEYYPDELQALLEDGAWLEQDSNVKMLYTENPKRFYVNGEWIDELSEAESALLCRIANGGKIYWQDIQAQKDIELTLDSLCDWLESGWLLVEEA